MFVAPDTDQTTDRIDTLLDVKQPTRPSRELHARINRRGNVQRVKVSTADNVYCPPRYVHNEAMHRYGYGGKYTLRTAGEVVEITSELERAHKGYEKDRGKGEGHAIREFSDKSRRRLAKRCAAISWGAMPFLFITLTYPGKSELVPRDGAVCAAHLNHFRVRWEQRFGAPICVWKREYQARGAVHFHLAILRPAGSVPLEVIMRWTSRTWWQVVGSGDADHLAAGTQVEIMRQPPTAYFSSHGEHGRDEKGYQNEVPADFRNPGRFWGTWNIRPDWNEADLSPEEFVEARRMMRAWAKSKRMRRRDVGRGRVQGMWVRTRSRPAYLLGADVMRAVAIAIS